MEKNFSPEDLDKQGEDYSKEKSVNYSAYIYPYRYKIVRKRMSGPKVLELGIGNADVTSLLSGNEGFEITSVDGSQLVLNNATNKVPHPERVTFVHSYFEDFETHGTFDDILMTNILEHVDDPVELIKRIKNYLKPDTGRLHITVPNAMSLHRMLGKEMGMLLDETALNVHDIQVGHQRVYTTKLMSEHINKAGLKIVDKDGVILKALSNVQINALIDTHGQKLVDGLFAVGSRLPEYAAEIYFCCKRR